MILERRERVETNARLLDRARWFLGRVHLRLNLLADIAEAQKINRIITSVEAERQRWLRAVDSPLL
ncbi:MAG: hypothetical protein ACRDRQ_07260 [Pseudonocardiaceae bacterium]